MSSLDILYSDTRICLFYGYEMNIVTTLILTQYDYYDCYNYVSIITILLLLLLILFEV